MATPSSSQPKEPTGISRSSAKNSGSIDGVHSLVIQLTQSGHDTAPQWSPDGQWIAFLSERKTETARDADDGRPEEGRGGDTRWTSAKRRQK
jgi:Tol biopolymer transport system component